MASPPIPNNKCTETAAEANPGQNPAGICRRLKSKVVGMARSTRKIAEDDPRRVVHAVKVGLALTLVSFLYYFRPLYDGFGQAGMWAILTVVLVFEFTVGGTLSKSLNRGGATLIAGALGIGAEYIADFCGKEGEPIVLGLMVFMLASVATFSRFFPTVKKRYDYGVMMFIITFTLVAVSGFRVSQILELAHQRLSTIFIGVASCIFISMFVFPVWAGQDLHNLIAGNLEKLGAFLEGFGAEFFSIEEDKDGKPLTKDNGKSFLSAYKSVLNSKVAEDNLANCAWWEPCHGGFRFRHPWKLYSKIGVMAAECANLIKLIHSYINSKPNVVTELHSKLKEPCVIISTESGKALKELSSAIRNMTAPSPATKTHIQNSAAAANELKTILEESSLPEQDLQEILPVLVVASVLIDIIKPVENISLSVHEVSEKAGFRQEKQKVSSDQKSRQLLHRGMVQPVNEGEESIDRTVVIDIGSRREGQETLAQAMERERLEIRS